MSILDSDAFLDMPLSTQALYLHLNMRADDDGFISNPKRVQRLIGASEDDLKLLLVKRFLLVFEDGVMVIKHWRMHNTIRSDRYTPTPYQDELSRLFVKQNKSYSLEEGEPASKRLPNGCQSVIPSGTTGLGLDIGLGLDSDKGKDIDIDKDKDSSKKQSNRFTPPTLEEVQQYCIDRNNKVDADRFINFYSSKGWMVGRNKMKDWKAAVRTWEKKDGVRNGGYSSNNGEKSQTGYSPEADQHGQSNGDAQQYYHGKLGDLKDDEQYDF